MVEQSISAGTRIIQETDEPGVKLIIEYVEAGEGKLKKITKKVRIGTRVNKIDVGVEERALWSVAPEKPPVTETPTVDIPKRVGAAAVQQVEKDEDYYFQDLPLTRRNAATKRRLGAQTDKETEPATEEASPAPAAGGSKYVPPGMRNAAAASGGPSHNFRNDRDGRTIRVSNLSDHCTDRDLTELFSNAGRVMSARVQRRLDTNACKGFGFVTFGHKEDAEEAIKMLNGHGFDNMILHVEMARSQGEAPPGGFGGHRF